MATLLVFDNFLSLMVCDKEHREQSLRARALCTRHLRLTFLQCFPKSSDYRHEGKLQEISPRSLTEDEVRTKAGQLLGFDDVDSKNARGRVGQIATLKSLGFMGGEGTSL